ncbi:TetR/AcrR family transcriptional regulator [Microbacterium murale]|uniref:AcrR family transcriptional regulator n=1 Tax=Microbacterium murale TaxID=1081040 RepID=A0ABU0P3X3_9MICO|nr:TetR/AcrR family transcriptional regulator [Microbacterium murale]MDQ0642034.1 AcrR family transcriptional regulator [Microbacterium murale]
MSWNTEATRRKLLEAATAQFADVGLAGARVDAISREAGVNKERIYQYFGDKAGLFAAVLAAEVEHLLDGISVTGSGADAMGHVAGALHDSAAAHPHLARLLAWESLELSEPVSAERRAAGCAAMVASLAEALPQHDRTHVAELVLSLISLALADRCLPHVATLVAPGSTASSRRAAVVAQARALAAVGG